MVQATGIEPARPFSGKRHLNNGAGGGTRTHREIALRQILNLVPRPFGYTRINSLLISYFQQKITMTAFRFAETD